MKTRILEGGGINWTWYCEIIELTDGSVRVVHEYRLHNQRDYDHPATDGTYEMLEHKHPTHGRTVVGIRVDGVERSVRLAPLCRWTLQPVDEED